MKRKILSVLAAAAVLIALTVSGAPAQDWPTFHHDPALSGYTDSTAPDTSYLLWTYDTGAPVFSSPAVADGILYIGSLAGNLYALNANTGSLIWSYAARGEIRSSPAVAEGKVYFLSTDGVFHAVDAATGGLVWSVGGMGGPWSWSSPAVHDGRVFVAASNGWVHSLDAATGAPAWSTFIGANPNGPIAVANGKVYSGTHNMDASNPTLVALDEVTGAVVWIYDHIAWHPPTVGMINSNGVAVVDGDEDGDLEVYFGIVTWEGTGNEAIALDEATGAEIWTQNLKGWSTSTPAVHNGRVYMGSDDHNIYALDAETGDYVWSFPTGAAVWSAPAVADGKVFAGSLDHTLYALDEATGDLIWSYYTSVSRIWGSPAVADGKVFVGSENGKVYAFGPINADIDIKPGSYPNSINVEDKGVIAVAILTTEDFDATTVDADTVRFGPAAAEKVHTQAHVEDADDDGDLDLVLHFRTRATGIESGDTEACLIGQTFDDVPIIGCDSVRTVP